MKNIKQKLLDGEATFGTWQMIGNTSISEILCDAGYEWITVDMEHTGIDVTDALELIRIIDLCGKAPAVRVSSNDSTIIKRVLDCGAKIIIVPMVMTKQDAQKAVDAVYYPPKGKRGVGLSRAQRYGFEFENYKEKYVDDVIVVAQIEHIKAIDNLEEILSVDGIDATMIGPYDLSGSLGRPGDFASEVFIEALKKYEKVSECFNKPMGYHIVKPTKEDVDEHIEKGYQFIALGFDSFYLGEKSREVINEIRGK